MWLPFKKLLRRRILINLVLVLYLCLVGFALLNDRSRVKYGMPYMYVDRAYTDYTESSKCRVPFEQLGVVKFDLTAKLEMGDLESDNKQVSLGGEWSPPNCTAWQRTAIIVPFRDRWQHFKILLKRLHPMLQRQKVHYRIFLIEQAGDEVFNRAKLLNIGVIEALKVAAFECFVFHDVDLIPEDDRNLYYCDEQLRHLPSAIDEMRYHLMYYNYVGGVTAVNKENIYKMNGFGNIYWGWGGEDDDFSARSIAAGLQISRPPENIGRFKMARHIKSTFVNNQYGLFLTWRSRWKTDGLNSVENQYKMLKRTDEKLYTKLLVDVGKPDPMPPQGEGMPAMPYWWFLYFFFP